MTKIIVVGSKGKMGKAVLACASNHSNIEVVGQIDVGDPIISVIANCDVVVDFSLHTATPALAKICAEHNKAMVIGTTGHTKEESDVIVGCAWRIPIVKASNFSTGSYSRLNFRL